MIKVTPPPFTMDEVMRLVESALTDGTDIFVGHFKSSGEYYKLKRQVLPILIRELRAHELFVKNYELGLVEEGARFPVSTVLEYKIR